jgi:hypothetical protein
MESKFWFDIQPWLSLVYKLWQNWNSLLDIYIDSDKSSL